LSCWLPQAPASFSPGWRRPHSTFALAELRVAVAAVMLLGLLRGAPTIRTARASARFVLLGA
jgi:hypothetical protein